MFKALLVFLGAGCGGVLRYWLASALQAWYGPDFPLGTLVINVTGCLVIGFLGFLWDGPSPVREEWRLLVMVGVLGGYTTFSAFGRETLLLVNAGQVGRAGVYVLASVVVSLAAVWLGSVAAKAVSA